MLDDRDYMRATGYGHNRWHTLTATLLIVNGVIFLFEALAPRLFPYGYLALSGAGLSRGYVWQLLTFQFLHANLWHLLLNSLGLFAFGFAVEEALGRKRFLLLYLTSGVVGGLVHVLGGFVWPSHFGVYVNPFGVLQFTPMVGASAGLFGLIAAFALMFPNRDLTVYLFFVLPVTVSARVLLMVSAGISVLGVLIDKSNVAHGAHAGGMLGGWLMLRWFSRQRRPKVEVAPEPPPASKFETDFVSKEVDPILEKISKHGIQSLTLRERKILDEARRKMDKR